MMNDYKYNFYRKLSLVVKSLLFVIAMLSLSPALLAQVVIEEVQPLSFGKLAIIKNDNPYVFSISHLGEQRIDAPFKVIEKPTVGIFRVSGLPVNSHINVNVITYNSKLNPATSSPELLDFAINGFDDPIRSDAGGEALLRVGGKITTSGAGTVNFSQNTHSATLRISVEI